ncbi:ATP-grasp domain-containing protein [Streptacidiphilus sp. N1-10]|uniref:ATP-grasp domain-containing protein n=1 Tax=Streptacidiphilus jeojiensis TaxID=3229225 RepID=A0ABV6Y0L1_9ACTN
MLLAQAAARRCLDVVVLDSPGVVETMAGRHVHWYGGPLAADRIIGRLGLALLEPGDDWLVGLSQEFTGRRIELTTLSQAWAVTRPVFVKPPSDKQFPAAVYADGNRLPREGERIGPDTAVLVSDVVTFSAEYRLFVLDGQIVTGSRYARYGHLDTAPLDGDRNESEVRAFARELMEAGRDSLPSAVAIDVGLIQDPDSGRERWAVVEANMPWFAHSYAGIPDAVLDVVLRASGPQSVVAASDRRFVRGSASPPFGPETVVCPDHGMVA